MSNGSLTFRTLSRPDRIPVAGCYLGMVTNSQQTMISGVVTVTGMDELTFTWPELANVTLAPGVYDPETGELPYGVTIAYNATPGNVQGTLVIRSAGAVVGHLVFTLTILDLVGPTVEGLTPVTPLAGAPSLLQLADGTHFETVEN